MNRHFSFLIFALMFAVLSGCGSSESEKAFIEAVEVNQLNVTSLAITVDSTNTVLEAGSREQLTVMATLDGGEQQDVTERVNLSSSDTSVFTVDNDGRLKAKQTDSTATVYARWADLSATLVLRVSTEDLDSISVTGPTSISVCSSNHEYSASGEYAVDDIRDISHLVTWSVSDADLASINTSGVLASYASGDVNVRAERNGVSSEDSVDFDLEIRDNLDTITLSPASTFTLTEGDTRQFTATANYDDASPSENITDTAAWASDDAAVLSIRSRTSSNAGLATAESEGTANVSASCDADAALVTSSNVAVTVETAKVIDNIEIQFDDSPSNLNLEISDSPIQLRAYFMYDDGSRGPEITDEDETDWSAEQVTGTVATVNNTDDKGEVTFDSEGLTEIQVVYDNDDTGQYFEDTIRIDVD